MPPGKENCLNSLLHAVLVARDVRVDLAVGALEIGIGDHARAAVAWTG